MNTVKAELASFGSLKDLKPILASRPPCLSIYMPLSSLPANQRAKANAAQWKECVRSLDAKVQQHGSEARRLLESISDWYVISEQEKLQGRSIAVFRAPD